MKRNKVLLGLYVGLLTLAGGAANAQSGNKFFEIGPANVGGHVTSLCLDRQDTNNTTIYAGAATGGLFVKSADTNILRTLYSNIPGIDANNIERLAANTGIWHRVPYFVNNREVSLPISCLAQGPDNTVFIGTGSNDYSYGTNFTKRSLKGSGVYRFNPQTSEFQPIASTVDNDDFTVVKDIAYIVRTVNGMEKLYLYVATSTGLYRWSMDANASSSLWNLPNNYDVVFVGNVDEIVISSARKTAYFASGNQLYSIGDATAPAPVTYNNISTTNSAFGGTNIAIKLAISHADTNVANTYLYAMTINANGLMDALYVTTDGHTWNTLTTSSVMPFTGNSGKVCGAIAIDPENPRRVALGGTNVQVGEGILEGAYYQWNQASASEFELNVGDYMSSVYNNYSFVHSGIHQILPIVRYEEGEKNVVYYIATDGGVYSTSNNFVSFSNENRGMNNVQINGLAVSPDGTLISGANSNACPLIEPYLDHSVDSAHRALQEISWYNDGSLLLNNDANIIWTGNGGNVAASAFQQLAPLSRRVIFTSSSNANFGRAYADYLDYTNTTTWTIGDAFVHEDHLNGGPEIGQMTLWETDNNTIFKDSIKVCVDTLGYIFRKRGSVYDTVWLSLPGTTRAVRLQYRDSITAVGEHVTVIDTIPVGTGRAGRFEMKAGDKANFNSRANSDYPFEYTFTNADVNMPGNHKRLASDSIKVLNPIQSRMLVVANTVVGGMSSSTNYSVFYSWMPTDFTKVYNSSDATLYDKLMWWAPLITIIPSNAGFENTRTRSAAFSRDGRFVFVSAYDVLTHKSMLFRLSGFENINYTKSNNNVYEDLMLDPGNTNPIIHIDTFAFNGSKWINRPISSIAVDNRAGQDRLILTFEDFCDTMPNVAIINNASTNLTTLTPAAINGYANIPAYCALVEDSTGTIYVGTENGVFTSTNGTSWNVYNNITGVPVTAIVQQTGKLPVRRTLTHTGVNANNMVFAKTKWPRALYFGTYGRGIFMDMTYVTDTVNEVSDPQDYEPVVDIPVVRNNGINSLNLFPNPVYGEANIAINAAVAGNGILRVYDLNGRCVISRNLGHIAEGEQLITLNTDGMAKGMYLINVIISGHTATAKMMVR